jgi:GT2 family glycosyltransferase/glycosyltransferase involved in cell wall biosynthesis
MNSPPNFTPKVREQTGASSGRTCVLVLGMHRSGTSALARVLSIAGAKLPATLLGANESNETGHWESQALMSCHDRLLGRLGSDWQDWRPLEIGRLPVSECKEIKTEIADLVRLEFGDAGLFVVKDPRICRFADLYLQTLGDAGIGVRIVHAVRNPLEVAQSLHLRNGTPQADAMLQWLRHVLDSEAATRAHDRVFVTFGALVSDWRAAFDQITSGLDLAWPYSADEISEQVEAFLDASRCHHRYTSEDLLLDPGIVRWVAQAYSALLVLTRSPRSKTAMASLDAVRAQFDHAAPVLFQFQSEWRDDAERTREALQSRLDASDAELKQAATAAGQDRQEIASLNGALAYEKALNREASEAAAHEAESARQRAAELQDELAAANARADRSATDSAERDRQLAELKTAVAAAQAAAQQHMSRAGDLGAALKQKVADGAALYAELEDRDRRLAALNAQVGHAERQAERQASELRRQAAEAATDSARAADEIAELRRRAEKAEARADALEAETRRRASDVDVLSASLAEQEQKAAAFRSAMLQAEAHADRASAELRRREARIADLDARLSQDAARAEQREQELAGLSDALEAERSQVSDMRSRAEETAARLTRVEADKEAAIGQANQAVKEITQHFRASTSWRLSAPVRVAGQLMASLSRQRKRARHRDVKIWQLARILRTRLTRVVSLGGNEAVPRVGPTDREGDEAFVGDSESDPDPIARVLNATVDGLGEGVSDPISRLMLFLWRARPDLQALFDVETKEGRREFAKWYLRHASTEYGLGPEGFPYYVLAGLADAPEADIRATARSLIEERARHTAPARSSAETHPRDAAPKSGRPGATLIGYARGEFGMGQQVRTVATACSEAEIPFSVCDFREPGLHGNKDRSIEHWLTDGSDHVCNVFNINADVLPAAYFRFDASLTAGKYNIGYWAWELPRAPKEFDLAFMMVDEVWAISQFVCDSLAERSPVPVVHMPLPVSLPKLGRSYTKTHFGLSEDIFTFLYKFDAASYLERKNPIGAVRAFKGAFDRSDERACLVLKTMNVPKNDPRWTHLLQEIDDDPRIIVMTQRLSREEAVALASVCDAFVSLHRSEGFGFCIAESMALGKPAISTRFSGSLDFAHNGTACVVDCTMIPVEPGSYPFAVGQVWADPDIDQASWYMRKLVEDDAFRRRIAAAGQRKVSESFSPAAIGRRYRSRFRELGVLSTDADSASSPLMGEARPRTVVLNKAVAGADPVFHLDAPHAEGGSPTKLTGYAEITGWAVSACGIRRIGVRCGGRDLGSAHYGILRADVGQLYPAYPASSRSGFSMTFDSRKLEDGPATLEIIIEDNRQAKHVRSVRVEIDNSEGAFSRWDRANQVPRQELQDCNSAQRGLSHRPLVSLVMRVTEQSQKQCAADTVRALAAQVYPRWQLVLIADASLSEELAGVAGETGEEKIKTVRCSASLKEVLGRCGGSHVGILDPGDELEPLALYAVAKTLNADAELDLIYGDEVIHSRVGPIARFKPAWSPVLFSNTNYIGRPWFAKVSRLKQIFAEGGGMELDAEHRILRSITERTDRVAHVPTVLCRRPDDASVDGRSGIRQRSLRCHEEEAGARPLVSIIIPTCLRDIATTRRCLTSLVAATSYTPIEVLLLTNNLSDASQADTFLRQWPFRRVHYDGPFNWSAINNFGARHAKGECLLFLNDDVEAVEPGWLDRLVECAKRSHADVVGPVLRYPNGTIQHAGVIVTNTRSPVRHMFRFCKGDEDEVRTALEFNHEVSAVTGACMLVSRSLFERLSGFDETFSIVCNDVDFCLRAAVAGGVSVVPAGVDLIHHEGISRAGMAETDDVARFKSRWSWLLEAGDPYYNPNLSIDACNWLVDPNARGKWQARKNPLRKADAGRARQRIEH